MWRRSFFGALLAFSLLVNAFCIPTRVLRTKRQSSDSSDSTTADSTTNGSDDKDISNDITYPPPVPYSDDDDDDDDEAFASYPDNTSSGGGSNLFSLLNLVTALLPGSSSSTRAIQKFVKYIVHRSSSGSKPKFVIRRQIITNNEVDNDYIEGLKAPPFLRQENEGKNNISIKNSESDSIESSDDNSDEGSTENDEENNKSNQDSNLDTNEDFDDDDDYEEPPGGGDGEGGGILGLLAGLSGGEDGQSDLGSLLATISGIVANLSGDGIDLNSLIASGIGLFVGLLSEGEENPGEIIASYLLTSLDTITGGGAKNNGAFFGKFLSKLVKGTSAAGDPDSDSEENGNKMETKDSAGFFASFLMGLLGDMSKTSSGSQPWRRYFDIQSSLRNSLKHLELEKNVPKIK